MLASHRGVEVSCLTSRSEAGRSVASLYPWLSHYGSLHFDDHSIDALSACDLVFYATPNKIAMNEASSFLDRNVRVIDLAADFRFSERSLWESVYGGPHGAPQLTQEAVYGLPEKYRTEIAGARLVGNPGCYPTATALALMPLVEARVLSNSHVIVDGKVVHLGLVALHVRTSFWLRPQTISTHIRQVVTGMLQKWRIKSLRWAKKSV